MSKPSGRFVNTAFVALLPFLLTPASAHAGFTAHALTCAPRYNVIVKSNPEGTPAHEEYKKRFFASIEALGEGKRDHQVNAVNNALKDLVQKLQSGNLPESEFWEQVNACDDEFYFPRSKP